MGEEISVADGRSPQASSLLRLPLSLTKKKSAGPEGPD